MWHIIANVDTEFDTMQECLVAYGIKTGDYPTFTPRIPATRAPSEDAVIPRLSVCAKLEDCFTAIGLLGRFRRCLAANEDAMSYVETEDEVYPILVCRFDGSLPTYRPSKAEVWDVEKTNELWLLQPVKPVEIQLRWLTPFSIIWDDDKCDVCQTVKFATSEEVTCGVHPWLTKTGNILESSLMDYDWQKSQYRKPWSETELFLAKKNIPAQGLTIETIQSQLFPYRSKQEIKEMLEKEEIVL